MRPDFHGFGAEVSRGLSGTSGAMNQLSRDADDADKKTRGLGSTLGDIGKTAAGVATGFLAFQGVQAVTGFLKDSVGAARESQQVNAQLDAVLRSTGGTAGVTAEEIRKMAGTMQGLSKFEDEAIISSSSLLLTFKQVGADAFPRAQQAILDVSQAMGQDLQTSTIQVGKALNDPVAGLTNLRRVGIQFTDEQENMIKVMVEAGDVAGAQNLILTELESQFGGSAKAASDAAGGSEQFKDRMNELKESIGTQLLPVIDTLASGLVKLLDFFSKNQDLLIAVAAIVGGPLVAAFVALGVAVLAPLAPFLLIGLAIGGLVAAIIFAIKHFDDIKAAIGSAADFIWNIITGVFNALPGPIQAALTFIAGLVETYFTTYLNVVRSILGFIFDVVVSVFNFIKDNIGTVLSAILDAISFYFNTYLDVVRTILNTIWNIIQFIWDNIGRTIFEALTSIWNTISSIWNSIRDTIQEALNDISRRLQQAWDAFWQIVHDTMDAIWREMSRLYEFGRDAVLGLRNGIMSVVNEVFEAAKSIANKIKDGLESVLGVFGSPPAKSYEWGRNIALGVAKGIFQMFPSLKNAAVGAARALAAAFSSQPITIDLGPGGLSGGVERWRSLVGQFFLPRDINNALRVMMGESGGDPLAFNRNTNGTWDAGLMQMNQVHGYRLVDMFDPGQNLAAAAKLFYQSGWSPWVVAQKIGLAHSGLDFVPATAPYLLERGERVISAAENKRGQGVTVNIGTVLARDESEARRAANDMGWALQLRLRGAAI